MSLSDATTRAHKMTVPPTKIFIVAGEASGDSLGAKLIEDLTALAPNLEFEGIAGDKMKAVGCQCFYPQERLAVFGAFEILHRYRELRSIHCHIQRYLKKNPPALFIGIDAPAFNLPLEKKCRRWGIKTIHYVSPSVWAWRPGRVRTIAKAVHLILTLFPFEVEFYQKHHVPVDFVGHPLARSIPLSSDKRKARLHLGIKHEGKLLALFPGSRMSEVNALTKDFLKTAAQCVAQYPGLQIVVGLANDAVQHRFKTLYRESNFSLPLYTVIQQSLTVMAASDVLLVASGTVSLEAMLIKRPMVVAYRISGLSYWLIARWLVKTRFFSLPNILAKDSLVPEYIQYDIDIQAMAKDLIQYLTEPEKVEALVRRFTEIHRILAATDDNRAAQAVWQLIQENR